MTDKLADGVEIARQVGIDTGQAVESQAYAQQVKRIMTRLRGSDFFSLADGEATEITLLADVDQWVEVPFHTEIDKKGRRARVICDLFIGASVCASCDAGKSLRRGLALSVLNVTSEMIQVAFWTMHNDSPLNDLEEAYLTYKVPFRGMRFRILRRGSDINTRYKLTYLGHLSEGVPEPATREQIVDVVGTIMARRTEKPGEE